METQSSLSLINEKLGERLKKIVGVTRGAFGLHLADLKGGWRFGINENNVFPQASAIKIPILMEVFKQAYENKFKLSDVRRIKNSDKTGGSGVLSELGDGTVELTLHDLCVLMITVSDNTATNLLIDMIGADAVNRTIKSLGFKQTVLGRRMMDFTAVTRGEENFSTPGEAAGVMGLLHRGEFIDRAISENVLGILKKPKQTSLVSALPAGTMVASKPGCIPGVVTEWAIVYAENRPYSLIVMENFGVGQEASGAIKEISKSVFDHFTLVGNSSANGVLLPDKKSPQH